MDKNQHEEYLLVVIGDYNATPDCFLLPVKVMHDVNGINIK